MHHNVAFEFFVVNNRGNDYAIHNSGAGGAVADDITVVQQLDQLVILLFIIAFHCIAQCFYAEFVIKLIIHELAVIGNIFNIIGLICRKHCKKARGKAINRNGFGVLILRRHFNLANALSGRLFSELLKHRIRKIVADAFSVAFCGIIIEQP